MASDPGHKASADLLTALGVDVGKVRPHVRTRNDTFADWVEDTGILPGSHVGIASGDLFRHYAQWCANKGVDPGNFNQFSFGWRLTHLGFAKGRFYRDGRDSRPRLMALGSANYFTLWLEQNPPAPVGKTGMGLGKVHLQVEEQDNGSEKD